MRWVVATTLGALVAGGCGGVSAKIRRADRGLAAFEDGDRDALDTSHTATHAATASKKGRGDAGAWARQGRVHVLYLVHRDLPSLDHDPALAATEAFESAVALGIGGADHGAVSEDVPVLMGAMIDRMQNQIEGRQWGDASSDLALALRVETLSRSLSGLPRPLAIPLWRLAVQIAAHDGDPAAARAHYGSHLAVDETHEPGLASVVARAFAADGLIDDAMAFLDPISRALPQDEQLLRTEVDLLLQTARPARAVGRIDRAVAALERSTSGAFLAASLYSRAGDEGKARASWGRTIALDPQHVDAHLALGQSLGARAIEVRRQVESSESLSSDRAEEEIRLLAQDLDRLWIDAIDHLDRAHGLAPSRREPVAALVEVWEARLAGIDANLLRGSARRTHAQHVARYETASNALLALED